MDITQALKDAENTLRDFVSAILKQKLGDDWVQQCGISPDRIAKWEESRETERKRQKGNAIDERLIYYAQLYDLETIIDKNWDGEIGKALGDKQRTLMLLKELGRLRDPDAHRRELLPHQKSFAIGVSGDLRSRLARYRSKLETGEDYFPRFECVRDNLGNQWTAGDAVMVLTKAVVRPGDLLEYVISASDPLGAQLEYKVGRSFHYLDWSQDNTAAISIVDSDIGSFDVYIFIRSTRQHHREKDWDACVRFFYTVLPAVVS